MYLEFWIFGFGFWIKLVSVSNVTTPNNIVWVLGFWVQELVWTLDFGFRISDFSHGFVFCYYMRARVGGTLHSKIYYIVV